MKAVFVSFLFTSAVASADLLLKPGDAVIRSESGTPGLAFSNNPVARLAHWSSVDATPVWGVEVSKPVTLELVLLQGYDGPAGNTYTLSVGPHRLPGTVQPNGNWHAPDEVSLGKIELPAGKHDLRITPEKLVHRAVMDLHGVKLVGDTSGVRNIPPSPPPANPFKGPGKGEKLAQAHPALAIRDITPRGIDATVGGIAFLPDGTMLVSTWDYTGSVYRISGYESGDPAKLKVSLFADGLLEPLGIATVGERIFVGQKHELTELVDRNRDGVADEHRCVSDAWPVSSNFHLFTFGPAYHGGKLYLNLAVSINPGGATTVGQPQDRGTCIAVDPDTGDYEVVAAGLRTPNGIHIDDEGRIFASDNQGDYLPANKIIHVKKGRFYNNQYQPRHPWSEREVSPPLAWLPQNEIGNSPTQPHLVPASWGPYAGQLLFGDIHYGGIQRAFIDEVDGELQGAVFRFSGGLLGGVNRLAFDSKGNLYAGVAGRGGNWGTGEKQGLQKLAFQPDRLPFEMLAMRAMSNGLEIEFTRPLAAGHGWDPKGYRLDTWTYRPDANYGGPKVNEAKLQARSASVSADRTRVFLDIPGLTAGNVVRILLHGDLRSESGEPAHAGEAFYTLNRIPPGKAGKSLAPPANFVRIDAGKETELARYEKVHQTYCISCHSIDGSALVGPSFKGLMGKSQNVIRNGATVKVTVDRDYILRGIIQPAAEYPEGFQPIMPESLHEALGKEDIAAVVDWIATLK